MPASTASAMLPASPRSTGTPDASACNTPSGNPLPPPAVRKIGRRERDDASAPDTWPVSRTDESRPRSFTCASTLARAPWSGPAINDCASAIPPSTARTPTPATRGAHAPRGDRRRARQGPHAARVAPSTRRGLVAPRMPTGRCRSARPPPGPHAAAAAFVVQRPNVVRLAIRVGDRRIHPREQPIADRPVPCLLCPRVSAVAPSVPCGETITGTVCGTHASHAHIFHGAHSCR